MTEQAAEQADTQQEEKTMDAIRHTFVNENGEEVDDLDLGSTRLGPDHEVVKTTVCREFNGSLTFTHTVARQHIAGVGGDAP